jgi:hypothetical protein
MRRAVLVVSIAACYGPANEQACTVACEYGRTASCPGNLVCGSDSRCHGPDSDICTDAGTSSSMCFGHAYPLGLLRVCLPALPTTTFASSGPISVNTNAVTMCQPLPQEDASAPQVCVIAATDIQLSGALRATGDLPLALVAIHTIQVSASIDVASHFAQADHGAGAQVNCSGMPGQLGTSDDGGGAGGSFGGAGGMGGKGASGTSGGMMGSTVSPQYTTGGCTGGDGGGFPASGGLGGGAVYLIAGDAITISGKIDASGAGAAGAANYQGGGGGGAGGLIGFDAPMVTFMPSALVFAQGGGGGQGGSTNPGGNGFDPTDTAAAIGGTNPNVCGGNGGAGATVQDGVMGLNGPTMAVPCGGGGGGGGAGFIELVSAMVVTNNVVLSPPPH